MSTTIDTSPMAPAPNSGDDLQSGTDPAVADLDVPTPSDANIGSDSVEALLLPPKQLVIDENVRKNFDLADHPEVADSVRQHGVLIPVLGHREADGTITVYEGQVRVLTALALKVKKVPVWVTPAPAIDAPERAIRRIAQQINANDCRIGLTEGDRAGGMAQMFAFGASLARIGREVGNRKRDQVKLAVAVGGSDTARRVVDSGQLDFEQAAVIAEYEAVGDTDAVARLMSVSRGAFGYEAKRIGLDRAESRYRFLESLPYAALGFGVLTAEPHDEDDRFIPDTELRTSDGTEVTPTHIHAHPGCWVVYCSPTDEQALLDRDTGATVDPSTVDWHTKGQPDTTPAEGMRHADSVEQRQLWESAYYLRAERLPDTGLRPASDFPTEEDAPADAPDAAGPGEFDQDDGRSDDIDPVVAQQRQEAAAAAAARRAEAERVAEEKREQERQAARRVRELNKQGEAALQARREFVTGFLTRKTPPVLAAAFVAEALADDPGLINEYNADRTAHELLGITGWRSELLKTISDAKPARCQVITLGLVLGAYEKRTGKDAWRHTDRGVRRYLHFLADNGHHLTPVEQAAAGDLDANTIDIDS